MISVRNVDQLVCTAFLHPLYCLQARNMMYIVMFEATLNLFEEIIDPVLDILKFCIFYSSFCIDESLLLM